MKNAKISLLIAFLAAPALAQTNGTYLLTSSNTVSPGSPTTTIAIWAAWDDPGTLFHFGGAGYDLTAGEGEFSNAVNVLSGPGSRTGVIAGNVITGAVNGQFFLGGPPNPNANNPILVATYDWTTADFRPRAIDLFTSNTQHFIVVSTQTLHQVNLFPQEFMAGSGVINVVPAPVVWLAIALPLVAGRRRRW